MIRPDVAVAALALVFSVTAAYESAKLPFGTIHKPGEGFFPFWISAVFFLLGLCLLFQALTLGPSTRREGSGRVAKVTALLVVLAAYTFPARSARLSALHVSPRPLHVARDRSPTVGGCSRHGANYRSRLVHRVCCLAGCSAASGTAVAGAGAKRYHRSNRSNGSSRSKRLKLSAAVERSTQKLRRADQPRAEIEQLERLEL